ncbi:MAG: extradiol dioxygenase family protein [Candidatus Paceibacteria bacterium]|jgi:extradiol dioxygenase family protein
MKLTPFHLAIQARDLAEARVFYGQQLGLPEGRSSDEWIDFNLFGHQLVAHLNPALGATGQVPDIANGVDGHGVPVPHFGVVLEFSEWEALAKRVRSFIPAFVVEPYVRFRGQVGEQGTMFFRDPSGNALEFKTFRNIEGELFAKGS